MNINLVTHREEVCVLGVGTYSHKRLTKLKDYENYKIGETENNRVRNDQTTPLQNVITKIENVRDRKVAIL